MNETALLPPAIYFGVIMTLLDEELIVIDQAVFETVCEYREQCDQKAEWIWTRPCCDRIYLCCSAHKNHALRWLAMKLIAIETVECLICGTRTDAEDFMRFEKL